MMRLFRSPSQVSTNIRLEGGRVSLRPPAERDWREYAELRAASREFLEPWEPTWPSDALMRDAFQRRLRRYASEWRDDIGYGFFLFRRENQVLMGGVSVSNVRRGVAQSATLGYWIGEAFARRGYMTEGLGLVLDFCFDRLGLHRIEAACLPNNTASKRLLLRCGFKEEGFARKYLKIRGQWHDHVLYGLIAEDHTIHDAAHGDTGEVERRVGG
ncbi:MAG: GNAT family N-acetyltransferase [Alphaproteobacteria bacterium]